LIDHMNVRMLICTLHKYSNIQMTLMQQKKWFVPRPPLNGILMLVPTPIPAPH